MEQLKAVALLALLFNRPDVRAWFEARARMMDRLLQEARTRPENAGYDDSLSTAALAYTIHQGGPLRPNCGPGCQGGDHTEGPGCEWRRCEGG